MGMVWMENLFIKNEKGQSTVEYILLFAVVALIVNFIVSSDPFTKLFGKDGDFGDVYKRELEYTYRHALYGREGYSKPNYGTDSHDSYAGGRFFGTKDPYPGP